MNFLLKLKLRSFLWLGVSLGFVLAVGTIVHGLPFAFWKAGAASFNISGVTGGTDATTDAYLSNGTDPTIHFETLTGATSYDIVIKDSAGVTTLCSSLGQASSPVSPSGCGLTNNTTYKIYVTGNPGTIGAANNGVSFTVDNTPPTTNTITGITGASDAVVDTWLTGGVLATVNWNAFTNAASYDVTIKDTTGTTTVCATQNTTGTSYDFSGCTLTDGTAYRAYVTARSAAGFQTTDASNTAFSFTVDNTAPGSFSITGVTGGTDVLVDSYLTDGGDPTVTFSAATSAYQYDLVIKDATDTTTVCSLLDQTSSPSAMTCGLTIDTIYKVHITAKSISGYMTTVASNDSYTLNVTSVLPSPAGNFQITGATGGSDTTADSWLTSGTTVTANWTASAGAQNYSVTIRNSTDTADVCATQVTASTSYTFSGCTLSDATVYLIKVSANNSPAIATAAINNGYAFQVITAAPGSFKITGATGGTDATADGLLMNGDIVTANWIASSGATSYDVTIRNSTDTADVCATQNTASTTYTFTGCTLSINTTYTIKVVAKNGAQSTPAYNGPFSFLVPNTITFCPTGSSTAKALIIYDSGGPTGNYSNSENCNFTISPPATAATIVLNFTSLAVKNGDTLTIYNGTNTSGTQLGSYDNTTTAPPNLTATSGNMHLTWSAGASQNDAGYDMNYKATYAAAGSFTISGVRGGSDVTNDNLLTDYSAGLTVVWGASSNSAGYDVVVRNNTNTADVCAKANTASTSYNFTGCNLMIGATYVVTVYSNNHSGAVVAATNNPYTFTYESRPTAFTISGITGGADATVDTYLEDGATATVTWTASTRQTSYDVTIYENDGYTEKCPTTNVVSGSTSHTFTGCALVSGLYYKVEVIAKNSTGGTLATNTPLSFRVGAAWTPTSLTGVPTGRSGHTAVWTGSEMIIWGGGNYNAGAKYNPATDSWTAVSTTEAPPYRLEHSAIWTGTEMIVWGGRRPSGDDAILNDGGKYNPSSNSWVPSSLSLLLDRTSHKVVWTGSEMIVWGGSLSGSYTNTGLKYNPSTDSWSATSTGANIPSARTLHTAVWTDSEMIVWGGYDGTNRLNTGGRYNPSSDSWTSTSMTSVPMAREDHTAIWTGTEMIVWGGYRNSAGDLNTGGRYDPSTDSWVSTPTINAPRGRSEHSAVWTGTEMIIWGGVDFGDALDTGGRYNPSTDTWTTSGLSLLHERYGHSAVWTGTEMIIWGGYGDVNLNTGAKYTPSTDSWTATSTGANVPEARSAHSAVWTDSEMIIWGGLPSTVTGGRYNPSSNSWTSTSTTNAPTGRSSHTAIWTGTEMIVWGGGNYYNTGGKYNPTSDSWTATSTGANVPTARFNHSAVWTGSEMIIWGGQGASTYNTGAKYTPSTDSWTATSTGANVPLARSSHSAVWTGTEMIVWGGAFASTRYNTGGKYNPTSDSWTSTSTGTNVPAVRHSHTAIWTDTEMIIWGGYGDGGDTNTGGRYNPSADTWTSTNTGANNPLPNNTHTAVWTGTEMIIWGGETRNTGGKYDPSLDTWTATSTGLPNVPIGRRSHSVVWTGSEMIIWGGINSSGTTKYNTGGKYNPTADTWSSTSTGANVPTARYFHSAIWTGTEMIVWGGSDTSSNTKTGGKYNPTTNSWAATSTGTNVPQSRTGHSGIWTGGEMIIWGGLGSTYFNNGAKYNPTSDSWIPTPGSANAPASRQKHKTVWTGSEMIIWGGFGWPSTNRYDTGGKYNPTTDTWTATSTGTNVPAARYDHTAIWTGTEMIIWGGTGATTYNTGAKYNPSTNSWVATSLTGAPGARREHTAIWTGTEMIVWGGATSTNTGAKYNPSADSWTATSTGANVPAARYDHTAIWTGTEMIIWGGEISLNTGGRYNPAIDSWTVTSPTNAPTGRSGHTAIWTGTNMIIWGGGSNLNSGGVYAP